jgi:hypothetical protein
MSYRLPERGDPLLGGDEPNVATLCDSALKRDLKIDDLDLMLDERSARFAVLSAPVAGTAKAVALADQPGAPISESIDHRCRTVGREAVELGARTIDVAGVKKQAEPVVGAVERAADKRGKVRRSNEPVPRNLTDDLYIIFGETKGRWLRRTTEPRQPNRSLNGGNVHTLQLYQRREAHRQVLEGDRHHCGQPR